MRTRLSASGLLALALFCFAGTAAAVTISSVTIIIDRSDTVRPDWLPLPLPPKFVNIRAAGFGRTTTPVLMPDTSKILEDAIIHRIGQKPRHK